ncbi:MAG: GNAT family N-acetyltransferase [Lachnospirales bacterium]
MRELLGKIEVVDFEKDHISNCIKMFYEVYTKHPFEYDWLKEGEAEKYIKDIYNTPNFLGFTLMKNSFIIGFCFGVHINYFKNNLYKINEIFVKSDMQGKGYGCAFVEEIEHKLKDLDIGFITLDTNLESRSIKFHEKNGFIKSKKNVTMYKKIDILDF